MPLDRRRFLVAAGAAGAAAAGGAAVLRFARGTSPGPGELTIMSGRDDSLDRQRHELVRRWTVRYPDNPARIVEVAGVADAQRSEMVARGQSRDGTVDIYNLDVTWTAEFAEAGYIRPLETSGLDTGGFLPPPLQTCRYRGDLWALPFNSDAGLLFYRADLVRQPPELVDWGWIEAQVREVFADPPDGLAAGYAGQLADYEGLTVNALERIWAAHGDVVTGDWREPAIEVDSELVTEALRQLARVFADEQPPLILPDAAQFDEAATTRAFRDGRVAFMRNWPVAFRSLQDAPDGDSPPAVGEVGVRRLPGPSVLGGQNLAVARHSRRPRAAQALIEFLTGESSQLTLFRDGGLPATRRSAYDDPRLSRQHPYAHILREAIEEARARPVTPYYARFSEVFRRGVRQAMRHPERPGTLPDGFARQLADALQGVAG